MYPRRDANKKSRSKTVFSRLSPPEANHLKPLSIYSRMVTCDQKNSPSSPPGQVSDQFVNFQVKIVNDHEKKRKWGDSSLKSNQFKKPYAQNTLSPDLGCYMDYSSPFVRSNLASPCTPSQFPLNENSPAWSEVKQTASSQLDFEFVARGRSKDPVDEVKTLQLSPKSESNHGNISPSFDYDVDSILGLNPLKHYGQKKGKKAKTDLRAVEEDKGYVSSFHLNENEEERNAEVSPEPRCHKRASFSKKDFSTSVTGPLLEPEKAADEYLEGDDDVLIIGEPIFESSICKQKSSGVQRSQSKVQKVSVVEIHDFEDSTVDLSWETTLPLQVQVKSKVVVPNQGAQSERSQRPKIYEDVAEWEHLKRQYVFSVSSHLTENQTATHGLMTELFNLMNHVAGQTGSTGSPWQHPSDLTCRNYQKRFGNKKPTMTLSEWKSKHSASFKRFGSVLKNR